MDDIDADAETSRAEVQPSLGAADDEGSVDGFDDDEIEDLGECEEEDDEDVIRGRQKLNSVATISSLRMMPTASSRFSIPLCRMIAMPMVRPTLQSDLMKLEQEFVHGYREGAAVFYVSLTNEDGKTQEVTDDMMASWGPLWQVENDRFNIFLDSDPELRWMSKMMFYVCDGNHRRQAWMNHIERLHKNEASWYYSVDSIVLDTKDRISVVMQVMQDINK